MKSWLTKPRQFHSWEILVLRIQAWGTVILLAAYGVIMLVVILAVIVALLTGP